MRVEVELEPYTPERVAEIIDQAYGWCDAFWAGTLSPHGDHGPIIAVTALAEHLAKQVSA